MDKLRLNLLLLSGFFYISPPVIMSKVHEVTKSDSKMLCILRIGGEHILWFKINEVLLKGNFCIFFSKRGILKRKEMLYFKLSVLVK